MKKCPTISACIISKNEESSIGKLLTSIKGVVDEIILVDTGSEDNTIEIAKNLGAKVYTTKWENSFSKARNYALDKATMEWIIYLDCDEYLGDDSKSVLKHHLSNENEAYCISLINLIDNKETLESQSLRLFKNRKEYRFKGRIHEQIAQSIVDKYTDKFIKYMPLKLYHTGYEPSVVKGKNKNKRNFEIFESYNESEKDGFYYYNLAGEYSRAGNTLKAIENYKIAYSTPAFENGFREYLSIYLIKALIDINHYTEALYYCNETFKKHPQFPDIHFLAASCYLVLFKYTLAYQHILSYKKYKSLVGLNYPDFKLEESNDFDNLVKDIKSKALFVEDYPISLIVDARESVALKLFETLFDVIDEVNIILSDKTSSYQKVLEQHLCNTTINNNFEDTSKELISNSKKSYFLILKANEYITKDWVLKLLEYVKQGKNCINSFIIDKNYNSFTEVRFINKDNSSLSSNESIIIYTI